MEQNPGGLLVKFGSVARQLLVAVEDGHHGEQERVARQLGDRPALLDGLCQPVAFEGTVGGVGEGLLVPMIEERLDLLGLEILEQEVPELGVPKPLGLVTDDPRRDDDRRGGVFVAEAVDVVDDLLPPGRVEDLVEPVQEEDRRIRSLQQAVQVHLVQSVIGLRLVEVAEEAFVRRAFPAVVLAELDQQGERLGVEFVRVGDPGPAQGEEPQERRFARARVPQDHQPGEPVVINNFQDRADRLFQV